MPTVIVPATSAGVGVTRRVLRSALADQLGVYRSVTVSDLASGPDANRVVISEDLRDDEDEPEFWGQFFVYVVDGDQAGAQRRVVQRGYHGSISALILSRPLDLAPEPGTTVLVTSPLPIERIGRTKGLNQIVQEAADRTTVEARLAFTGDGSRAVSLVDAPYVTNEDQLRGIYDARLTGLASDPLDLSPDLFRLALDGADRSIVVTNAYGSGESFEVAVGMSGGSLIYSSGAWAYSTSGLTSDDDQVAVPTHWIVAIGMVKALQHLRTLIGLDRSLSPQERAIHLDDVERRMRVWAPAAAEIKRREFPQPVQQNSHPSPTSVAVHDPWATTPLTSSWPN